MKVMRVLVADQNMYESYERDLRYFGHHATGVSDAARAWKILEKGEERFDLVLSSYWTGGGSDDGPNISGVELLRLVRGNSHTADVRFIMMYLHEEGEKLKALKDECERYGAELICVLDFHPTAKKLDILQNQLPLIEK